MYDRGPDGFEAAHADTLLCREAIAFASLLPWSSEPVSKVPGKFPI